MYQCLYVEDLALPPVTVDSLKEDKGFGKLSKKYTKEYEALQKKQTKERNTLATNQCKAIEKLSKSKKSVATTGRAMSRA